MIDIVLLSLDLTKAPAGTVHRLTSNSFDVLYNGNNYSAVGDLLNFEDIENMAELTSIGTTLSLSGIDPAYRIEIDNGGFLNAPIDISIAQLPANTNIVPDGTAAYFHRGTCDTPNTEIDYESGTMSINIGTRSVFGNLDKVPDLCRTSQSSHKARHAGDDFFKYVASIAQEEIWKS
ncbi:MAG: hypothetical protein COA84_14040 [Robiginitomaculum sp.]|nr:MAG: hypothetical protein COA84_14040 [Robiginitomaculum sp.]